MRKWFLRHYEESMPDVNGSYRRSFATSTHTTTAIALSIAIAIAELGCRLLEHPINLPRMQCVCILRHLL